MTPKHSIDLNADLGEGYGAWRMGDDAEMLGVVTSVNIACGGHAGDAETMFATLCLARDNGVTVGAHPGYEDRAGFGRRIIPMSVAGIERMVAVQVGALMGAAALAGCRCGMSRPMARWQILGLMTAMLPGPSPGPRALFHLIWRY